MSTNENTQISQKQAVLNAITSVLGDDFVSGSTNVREALSTEQLEEVQTAVFEGITNGSVSYGKETSDSKTVRRYVNGMIDNHMRKAKELNGGVKYTPASTNKRKNTEEVSFANAVDASSLPEELQDLVSA